MGGLFYSSSLNISMVLFILPSISTLMSSIATEWNFYKGAFVSAHVFMSYRIPCFPGITFFNSYIGKGVGNLTSKYQLELRPCICLILKLICHPRGLTLKLIYFDHDFWGRIIVFSLLCDLSLISLNWLLLSHWNFFFWVNITLNL